MTLAASYRRRSCKSQAIEVQARNCGHKPKEGEDVALVDNLNCGDLSDLPVPDFSKCILHARVTSLDVKHHLGCSAENVTGRHTRHLAITWVCFPHGVTLEHP